MTDNQKHGLATYAPWAALALSVVLFLGSGLIQLNAMNLAAEVKMISQDTKKNSIDIATLAETVRLDHELIMAGLYGKQKQ